MFIAAVTVLGGGYYWWRGSQSSTGAVQYVTATAEKGTITTSISGSGNVIVDQLATVDPTVSGTVTNLSVKEGDSVKKGQLLFVIDDNNQLGVTASKSSASYQQSQNSLESARVSVLDAEASYRSAKNNGSNTGRQNKVLKDKIGLAKLAALLAQKNVDIAKADYQTQLANAAKRQVVSPIDGTVNAVNVKNGDALGKSSSSSTSTAPIVVGDLKTLKAQVSVNEVDVSHVALGQKVTLTLDALDSVALTGKVEKIDALGTISQGVVSYNVTIDFDALNSSIKPDMSVTASIITEVKQDVIVVPNGAVKSSGGTSYVQVLNSGQTPENRDVEVGASNATSTEIMSGISVGDKVVTQTINAGSTTTATSTTRTGGGLGLPGLGGGGRRGD